jgi:Glycoside hydrolase family 44
VKRFITSGLVVVLSVAVVRSQTAVNVQIDVAANRHPIDARIYGVAFADQASIADLHSTLNRWGGNATSRYNWQINAENRASDWYFESIGLSSASPGGDADTFVSQAKTSGAAPLLTIPMVGWVAKLGSNRAILPSFSIAKYGPQTGADPYDADAGNGISVSTGLPIIGNDPNDADVPSNAAFQQGWLQHLVSTWGTSAKGGVGYYALDNEPSIWQVTHRDVHPIGPKMGEVFSNAVAYATQIKADDAGALVLGPEEWGWTGYFYSGYDQQWAATNGWNNLPDRTANGNQDYLPWLLSQLQAHDLAAGQRTLDIFSVHFYPQGGEYSDDVSTAMQQLRNRSTRALWDPNYVDESWIATQVQLIPRLQGWVATNYPGTKVGITEYNWGAEAYINGATTLADVLGIFGRQGLDLATYWSTPAASTPTYKAMKLYRNYDGQGSAFGDISVSAVAPNPDSMSVFAAQRTVGGALTIMAVNKDLSNSPAVNFQVANFTVGGPVQVWQLTASNSITRLADATVAGTTLAVTLPTQSITLFVIPAGSGNPQAPSAPTDLRINAGTPGL